MFIAADIGIANWCKDFTMWHMKRVDVIVIGAGAAGLMCAIEAGKRGRSVVVLDKSEKAAEKNLSNVRLSVQLHKILGLP